MTNIPILETARLIMRAPTQADFAAFSEFYASERSHFVGGPLNAELSWRMLAMEIGHWSLLGYGRWIAEEKTSGAAVGLIGLFNPHGWPEPEIGWDLFTGFEGKGYATEAALAARAYAYDTLQWQTAISLVKTGNDGSAALARRIGATPDGEFTHERHGHMTVYRHPAPGPLTDGGIESYA